MAALLIDNETLATVRGAKILSRSIRLPLASLPPELAEKVGLFLAAIGGVWSDEKQTWQFKKHPLAAIGWAIMEDIIICQPAPSPTLENNPKI